MRLPEPEPGKYTGHAVELAGLGRVELTQVLARNNETELYHTDQSGVLVKLFDLGCGKADEVSYGPYLAFQSELANFQEVQAIAALRPLVPAYHGAQVDYESKCAWIAMEHLLGQDLRSWCGNLLSGPLHTPELDAFRRVTHEMLRIIREFHAHGFVLIDFKPDNVFCLDQGGIRLIDLGAFFTPRHARDPQSFVYAATPDHAEVLIDASNLQTGLRPTETSDVFAAGVALFELATGTSRLAIEPHTADEILGQAALFRYQDSQTRDVWKAYPHLQALLPTLQTQLGERRTLFADVWHLLKAYVGSKVEGWESLEPDQRDQILLATGTTFIQEQLPPRLAWLAGPIAQATVLRSLRARHITDLLALLHHPIPQAILDDLDQHNCLVGMLRRLELPVDFLPQLNSWEVRQHAASGHWAMAAPAAAQALAGADEFVFLQWVDRDSDRQVYWHAVEELDAPIVGGRRTRLRDLAGDHAAWIGTVNRRPRNRASGWCG